MRETPAPPQRHSQLLGICLLYLLLPNILFLVGWVEPWLAWPLVALLSAGCWLLWRRSTFAPRAPMTQGGKAMLALCLLGGAAVVYLMGLNGDFPQPRDFIARNGIYGALVNETWPLLSARGEYFVYYHAFWLPAAAVADILRSAVPGWLVLAAWIYLGVALCILCLFRRCRRRTLSLLAVMMGLACAQQVLGRADVFAAVLPIQGFVDAYNALIPQPVLYTCLWHQLAATYNHAVAVMLFLCMVHGRLLNARTLLPVAALVVACSPLGALALLVYLACILLPQVRRGQLPQMLREPMLYAVLPLLALMALYFSSGAVSQAVAGWNASLYGGSAARFLPAYLGGTLFMVGALCVFGWRYRRTSAFRAAALLLVIMPLVWLGLDTNEFLYKGSLVPFFVMAVLLHGSWPHAGRVKRAVVALLFAACTFIPALDIQHRLREFGTSPAQRELNLQNEWQGHLNHPEHPWYRQFWGPQAPPFFRK